MSCQLSKNDNSLLQGLLQKVKKGRGTRVSLTASHSSTIAEETIKLLRVLHRLPAWNKKINEFVCLKMSLGRVVLSCWQVVC